MWESTSFDINALIAEDISIFAGEYHHKGCNFVDSVVVSSETSLIRICLIDKSDPYKILFFTDY